MKINKSHVMAVLIGVILSLSMIAIISIMYDKDSMPKLEKRMVYQTDNVEIIKSYYSDKDSALVSVSVSDPERRRSFGGVYNELNKHRSWKNICYYCNKEKDVVNAEDEMFVNLRKELNSIVEGVEKPANLTIVEK